jgi:hypothetical protein
MSLMFYLLVATDLIPTISLSKSARAAHRQRLSEPSLTEVLWSLVGASFCCA